MAGRYNSRNMGRSLTLSISDRLEALLKARASARGHATLDECVLALLDEALGAARLPQVPPTPGELVAELSRGLAGTGRAPTRSEWDQKKQDLSDKHRRSKAG